jgi:hypothetical protein
MPIDRAEARRILVDAFASIEADLLQGRNPPSADASLAEWCRVLFETSSQGFREALLGCALVHLLDPSINIRLPYVKQGPSSISLRMFDQNVVNPFMQEKRIPGTKGPYLSMFRRGYQFTEEYPSSNKDPIGNRAFLDCIARLESLRSKEEKKAFLNYLLYCFWDLREKSVVPLTRIRRLALSQYDRLISGLLSVPSGGRIPVVLVVTTFHTLKQFFNLGWTIDCQGINVSDAASGAGGDITITEDGNILMAIEVTERIVDRSRLVSTFNTKIAPAGIVDYLFFTKAAKPDSEAAALADQYFAQGHEVTFLEIKNWMLTILSTIGSKGRAIFITEILKQLDKPEIPKAVKAAWNEQVSVMISP